MAPLPEDCESHVDANGAAYDDNDIVISGMSGVLPDCHNLLEFDEKLYNKVNMVTKENLRWNYEHPELSEYAGMIPDIDLFDAEPFVVHSRLANVLDPMTRLLLEQSYQALFDAGVNPTELSNKRVGVFIAASHSETEKIIICSACNSGSKSSKIGLQACSRAMSANRISYWLNVTGPSIVIDSACCSSVVALEKAYQAVLHGECDSAIVGGSKILLHPQTYISFQRTIPVNQDGKTKSYDMNADGQSESEAVNVIYLQKRKDAKRIYASLRHVKTGFGAGENFWQKYGPGRDVTCMVNFLNEFYNEAKLSPSLVEYVEGFGAAIPGSDKSELEAIDEVFCYKRMKPLLVGSVMSNIGYTEAACGLSALIKVLLAYHKGKIAANLNCATPRDDVNGLREGRIRIVTDHQPFQRSYVALNQFSFTGVNGHVLLQGQFKPKNIERYACDLPYLVTASGRREDSVKKIINDLKSRRIDPEEIAILHCFHKLPVCNHMARGYGIYASTEQAIVSEDVKLSDVAKRPLWFVYSGMGSQWNCMGSQLLRIPIFSAAIERCRRVLEPRGVDIIHILTSSDKTVYDNILNSFVGIAAIQIGLTDILNSVGLVPDKIIGHSVGELGCAYADGCFTAEEMILAAYSRGLVSIQTPFIYGSMAAVGIGYKKICKMCPPEIEVACHNGPDSSTISGPAEVMRTFVAQLSKEGIFAKEVPCSNIAYHSRYIAEAGPGLLKCLKEVIKEPKLRSKKWVSTSVPQDRWDEASAKYSSAEYHTNNLLSPVLFEETSTLVPANAVLVEVAPHGLLQAILKRSLPDSCQYIPLTRRDHADNTLFFLEALGKIYMEGYEIDASALYPKVEFPVSTETRPLSHLVDWVHSSSMVVQNFTSACRKHATIYKPIISLYDAEHEYLTGHVIEGSTVFPFAGALVSVWDTIAMNVGKKPREVSIEFQDVHLYEQPRLFYQRPLHLKVTIQSGCGRFEVTHKNLLVATGYVLQIKCANYSNIDEVYSLDLNENDIYKLFFEKGYEYKGEFRSIVGTNQSLTKAQLVWNNNWVTLIDSIIQLNALRHGYAGISQPKFIKRISINVKKHLQDMFNIENSSVVNAQVYELHNETRCEGLLIQNISFKDKPKFTNQSVGLKSLEFRPFFQDENKDGVWGREFFLPLKEDRIKTDGNFALQSAHIGDISSLRWVEAPEPSGLGIPVTVHYVALNVTDANRATAEVINQNSSSTGYAMDFSGITDSGESVMGLVSGDAACQRLLAKKNLLWPVPAHWTLEEAATVPLPYAIAFYCLAIKGKLCQGMSILVHGGAGALGQAVISIALAHGCQVFTTVSDIRKKHFLKKMFPNLKDDHIGNSRDATFGDMVLFSTKGKGCNIIISCVKGELRNISLKCSSHSGKVFDTVQIKNQEGFTFHMANLLRERSYIPIDFSSVFMLRNENEFKDIQLLIAHGISQGYVRPLSRVTYPPQDVARAFRLLAASGHRGRVLIRLNEPSPIYQQRLTCSPEECYVILCDGEGFGIQLADRLVASGVRKLHVLCPSTSGYLDFKKRLWEQNGVQVKILHGNLDEGEKIHAFLNTSNDIGPVRGIFVIVATDNIQDEYRMKLNSAMNFLNITSRTTCTSLKHFVMISNGSNVGREICFERAQSGLPALSISLNDLKKFVESKKLNELPSDQYLETDSAFDLLERALNSEKTVMSSFKKDVEKNNLMEEIAKISGLNISSDTPESFTFEMLGLSDERVQELYWLLNTKFKLDLPKQFLPQLSIAKLKKLHNENADIMLPKKSSGFQGYLTNSMFDREEVDATADMIQIPTLLHRSKQRGDEYNTCDTYLCIVPGMEGHRNRFKALCERLKLPAVMLFPEVNRPDETLREVAQRLVNIMMKRLKQKNNFFLLGYESGVLLALEMSEILEGYGKTGTVYCVGGTPEDIHSAITSHLGDLGSERLQDSLLEHIYQLIVGNKSETMKADLLKARTWDDKLTTYLKSLRRKMNYSSQYMRTVIESAYFRIQLLNKNHQKKFGPLRSKIVILKAVLPVSLDSQTDSKLLSDEPLVLHELSATLPYATEDMRCSAIINKYLGQDCLDEFNSHNQCESYLLDDTEYNCTANSADL